MIRPAIRASLAAPWASDDLVRAELFSAERLEEHAASLAAAQPVITNITAGRSLARRLRQNDRFLLTAHRSLLQAVADRGAMTPASQWLVDNYHVVQAQIREIRDDLPPGYYRQLPKLASGPFAGYPRILGVAWAFVAHTDSRFDAPLLVRFMRAYQRVQPLSIGELWAVAITLRVVLVENLRRAAGQILRRRAERRDADAVAEAILAAADSTTVPTLMARIPTAPLHPAFAVQLMQRLHDQDAAAVPALQWIEERLAEQGTGADAIIQATHQNQGAMSVTVRNIITSMRLISAVDWTDLVEEVSLADDMLRAATAFGAMDFPTRNHYRSAIEELARGARLSELEVVQEVLDNVGAVEHAALRGRHEPDARSTDRTADPGYYLIGDGRAAFEAAIGFSPPLAGRVARVVRSLGLPGYVIGILALTSGIAGLVVHLLVQHGLGGWGVAIFAALALFPAAGLAVALIDRLIGACVPPRPLPALALRDGVPAALRTMVVVPTLLTSAEAVAAQIEQLEVHHLASPDGEVLFALLSDWTDAPAETMPDDAALLELAVAGIERLNRRHCPAGSALDFAGCPPRFLLLHRRRRWNAMQGSWMGWERKRGKLLSLNRWLRGASVGEFIDTDATPHIAPAGVRYVVTLDSDTRLPRDTVRRLVGKMAHPLNRPRLDAALGRVVEGHGILQPRVTPSLSGAGSLYRRAFSVAGGIDPYAAAVSDVYQDLLGEGSFVGKGIYDVDIVEATQAGRVPDNALLSHDLFEGIFARAGLASDVEVVEASPARYDVAAARQHRWTRGDWQLLPWVLGPRGRDLPFAGRWKMLDNLRRSLTPPMLVLALLAGWQLAPDQALLWTCFVLVTVASAPLLALGEGAWPRRRQVDLASHRRAFVDEAKWTFSHIALVVALLAAQASLMVDAIGRTLLRLAVTRRNLLEWTTAEQVGAGRQHGLADTFARMWGTLGIGAAALAGLALAPPGVWLIAAPFAVLWLAAPAVAWWISGPLDAGPASASAADAQALRLVARRNWRFFETFVTPAHNMLPPDNFQEDPKPVVAGRTSPTNIGLYLLSLAAARAFGWIGLDATVARLEAIFATLDRMERVRGHFLNWYDTADLRPLEPRYVSTVDSGNLAGHLIALANACEAWISEVPDGHAGLAGTLDALAILHATVYAAGSPGREGAATLLAPMAALSEAIRPGAADEDAASAADRLVAAAAALRGEAHSDLLFWAEAARIAAIALAQDRIRMKNAAAPGSDDIARRLFALAGQAREMAAAMRFDLLLNTERRLLSLGFVVSDGRLDEACYDLLASEARLASFLAIAQSDVPVAHWFRLGRTMVPVARGAALVSWSGSMFEYLMPALVLREPPGSLLADTGRVAVDRQMRYATALGLPWGISESAFAARDIEMTYQYSAFGVPDLALKLGLAESLVIAPYATGLAAMVDPAAAARNFDALAAAGALGRHGFYEALDYTSERVPAGRTVTVVRAFMAHHQGMAIVAIANTVLGGLIRTWFHAEPLVQANELLLEERPPRDVSILPARVEAAVPSRMGAGDADDHPARRVATPHGAAPASHILSNGRYTVMLTAAGSGYSHWRGRAVTRWREDTTRDDHGSYIYLRDVASGAVWSAGYQPSGREADHYLASFTEEHAEITRRDGSLLTHLEVVVSAEDDAEVRRVTLTNAGTQAREVEVTSYLELALAPPTDDAAHPAFSKMFVQTEFLASRGLLLATRRRRHPDEAEIWAAHLVVAEGETIGDLHVETDRAQFLGRGRGVGNAAAMVGGRPLSGTVGTVLDPVFSLRRRVRVAPGTAVRLAFWTMAAASREEVLALADRHSDSAAFERAFTFAWTQAQVQLRHLAIRPGEAACFQRLAGFLIHNDPRSRPPSEALRRGAAGPAGLWAHGISGDVPILLVHVHDSEGVDLVRRLLAAHEYWRMKQLAVDLVILNERTISYNQDLQLQLEGLVRMGEPHAVEGGARARGGVFVLRGDVVGAGVRDLLRSVARVVLNSRRGNLSDQLDRLETSASAHSPARRHTVAPDSVELDGADPALEFFNGLGGFALDGREYVTILRAGATTPAPWTNVVANPDFGFLTTADGGGYSWWRNSRENQLTAWSNDPVTDPSGDVIYLRDEESGAVWGPTPQPVRIPGAAYRIHHGIGYSRFCSHVGGIEQELLAFVPPADPVKIMRLTLRNSTDRRRHLSVSWYVEWVLGPSRAAAAPHIATEHDPQSGAVFATNPWNTAFGPYVAFAAMPGRTVQVTGDRAEFIGRNGTLGMPAALAGSGTLSGRLGAGLDPCTVLQTSLELNPGETVELVLLLGASETAEAARQLVATYGNIGPGIVLDQVRRHWAAVIDPVQVATPDRAMDIMLNGWLQYQTLACRVWARAGFYQSSGAYGFRDQLQDGMTLVLARPELARAHLLRAAGRQFIEGDVQHWWLPPSGVGVRTRISDDRIWLGAAALRYLTVTADRAVLDAPVPFLEGPVLAADQHEAYFLPTTASTQASLYEHCALGLDASLATGAHGLPLFGTGDWNDGMSRVGAGGTGESVWLGWFLYAVLQGFAPVAEARGEAARASVWRAHAAALQQALEREAWDGDWYRRGFYDDGTALGSVASSECRIDAIAQSWSVISGAADPQRAARAMTAMGEQLIRRHDRLALLFTPPFDHTPLDPGYIKGYPPGLRENGGQYTHAGLWSVIALAMQGDGDRAGALFAMLNPINHALSAADAYRYKVEPYVVAADVYAAPGHVGRGGWTWYTGSAGWMYRAGLEHLLGICREGSTLRLSPCIPRAWPGYVVHVRHGAARYVITVENPNAVSTGIRSAWLDGREIAGRPVRITLLDDGAAHAVRLVLGPPGDGGTLGDAD